MKKQHIVFWMPTIFHTELDVKKNKIINTEDIEGFFDLSDKSKKNPYFAKFALSDNADIIISSKVVTLEGEVPFDTTLTLDKNQKRKNGFMQFFYDEDAIPESCKISFRKNLTSAFYDKVKEFYHEHECNTGKDSDLHPKITQLPINLESDDNPALISFLEDFSELFYRNAKSVSILNKQANEFFEDYKFVRQEIEKLQYPKQQDLEEFKKVHNDVVYFINALNKLLENSSIEYTYCKTLLTSIHNKSFKPEVILNPEANDFEIKNNYRRLALNIRNAVRYIENVKYKNQNRQNEFTHISIENVRKISVAVQEQNTKIDQTLHDGKKWQRIGISLAVYSALTTLLFGFKDKIWNNTFNFSLSIFTFLLLLFLFLDIPKYFTFMKKTRFNKNE